MAKRAVLGTVNNMLMKSRGYKGSVYSVIISIC